MFWTVHFSGTPSAEGKPNKKALQIFLRRPPFTIAAGYRSILAEGFWRALHFSQVEFKLRRAVITNNSDRERAIRVKDKLSFQSLLRADEIGFVKRARKCRMD